MKKVKMVFWSGKNTKIIQDATIGRRAGPAEHLLANPAEHLIIIRAGTRPAPTTSGECVHLIFNFQSSIFNLI